MLGGALSGRVVTDLGEGRGGDRSSVRRGVRCRVCQEGEEMRWEKRGAESDKEERVGSGGGGTPAVRKGPSTARGTHWAPSAGLGA